MRIMHLARATLMVCQFMVPMIRLQKRHGHYVCVCSSDDDDVRTLRDLGIDVFPHRLKRGLNPINVIREIFRIKSILLEQRIDVLVCHTPLGASVGRIAARLAGVKKVIYFSHGLPCAPGQNKLKWFFYFAVEKLLSKITDSMIVMNDYDEELCKKHMLKDPAKVIRVPGMGVDLEKFQPTIDSTKRNRICAELQIPTDTVLVLCVAYLIPEKGIWVLFDAARQICARRNDVHFLLAGNGPDLEKLQNKIDASGIQDNFKLLGWRNDVDRLMSAADIFVLPTYYFEGLPVSILEAMASGTPVIATRHRGCEDVVNDGETGFLIPIKNVKPLIDATELLACDVALRKTMSVAARKKVQDCFELNYCTELIAQALEKAWN